MNISAKTGRPGTFCVPTSVAGEWAREGCVEGRGTHASFCCARVGWGLAGKVHVGEV